MKDLPNIYDWNKPYDILDMFDTNIYKDKFGFKYVITFSSEQMLLFKVNGRYILPKGNDLVKYYGNGEWAIKEEPSWMIG